MTRYILISRVGAPTILFTIWIAFPKLFAWKPMRSKDPSRDSSVRGSSKLGPCTGIASSGTGSECLRTAAAAPCGKEGEDMTAVQKIVNFTVN